LIGAVTDTAYSSSHDRGYSYRMVLRSARPVPGCQVHQ
jgi:hypothetical protein